MNVHSDTANKTDKRTLILKTSLELLSENGFHGTPISMIAEKARVGAGTIYRYFENKEDLINNLFKDIKKHAVQSMLKDYDKNVSFKGRFKHLWLNLIRYFIQYPTAFQFIEQHRYATYIDKLTKKESSMIMSPVMLFFVESKKAKAIKDLPLHTILALSYGPITALAKLLIDHNQQLSEEGLGQAADACWDAVRMI